MYGIQTIFDHVSYHQSFENDVNMYGIQTVCHVKSPFLLFENDVNMYGIQTIVAIFDNSHGLRMM